jgi:SAM-dependent methyltransferase
MDLVELVALAGKPPEPWQEGRTIPWDDPEFSARMLQQHLSQSHDAASRRYELIDRHVEFIREVALPRAGRVLDLGCGPGLYCIRLAARGHDCTGIDFGPASIDYARQEAQARGLACRFHLGDIRGVEFGTDCDLVMLLYGELNLFPPSETVSLLRRCAEALTPEGSLLLEVHSYDKVRERGLQPPRWSAQERGLFCEKAHLRLDESFWLEERGYAVGRHWIVDAAAGRVRRYGWTMRAYTDQEYAALLREAGLRLDQRYESLTGAADGAGFPVLLARRA